MSTENNGENGRQIRVVLTGFDPATMEPREGETYEEMLARVHSGDVPVAQLETILVDGVAVNRTDPIPEGAQRLVAVVKTDHGTL